MLSGQQLADKKRHKKKRDLTGVPCYGCGKHGHLWREVGREVDDTGQGEQCQETSVRNAHTAVAHTTVPAKEGLTDSFYIDLGASDHFVPSKGDLRADRVFEQLVEIAVANSGKIYAYGTGYLRVATPASVSSGGRSGRRILCAGSRRSKSSPH